MWFVLAVLAVVALFAAIGSLIALIKWWRFHKNGFKCGDAILINGVEYSIKAIEAQTLTLEDNDGDTTPET